MTGRVPGVAQNAAMSALTRLSVTLVLLVCCLLQSGCFHLIRALLNPVETAQAIGGQVVTNVAQELAGGGMSAMDMTQESIRNIDRILEEHPDAANRHNLERLRSHLSEETGDISRSEISDQKSIGKPAIESNEAGAVFGIGRKRFTRNEHNLHLVEIDTGDPFKTKLPKNRETERVVTSAVSVEGSSRPYTNLRSNHHRDFPTVPATSTIRPPKQAAPLMERGADGVVRQLP